MFDPATMSMLFNVGSSLLGGLSEMGAADYEAQQAEMNKRKAKQQGKQAERQVREEGRRAIGKQKAIIGGSGFTSSGTMLDVINESLRNAEYDALTTREEAESEAANYGQQSQLAKKRKSSALMSGLMGAGTALFDA